jgi:molybdate transport system ATP-binding protein
LKRRPFITLDQVTVRIGGAWILDRLSWRIDVGQNWVLRGPNGAGKSTLAKALLGRVAVVQGKIHRHYETTSATDPPRVPIALVSSDQQIDFYRHEQLLAQMRAFSHRLDDVTRSRDMLDENRCDHPAIGVLDIDPLLEKPLQVLSAGEMRRLLIARALIQNPRMLIFDEPFNGLDRSSAGILFAVMQQLTHTGTQLVLITHRATEIPPAFSHLLHIDGGRIKWCGPLADALPVDRDPSSPLPSRAVRGAAKNGGRISGEVLIRMRDVNVRYGGHKVLCGVDWTVRAGENWALVGPNGAGKSTLLKLITGDNLQGYANELVLFGRRKGTGESLWEVKAEIGYVADDLQLRYQKKMNSFDVVCSGFFDSVGLFRQCSAAQRQIAQQWMATAGIEALSGQCFAQLSFGQQRMVLIVRAMVKAPRLLILDEPCNGLDGSHRRQLLELLDKIGFSGTASLLYVSHRTDEVPACITHRLFLKNGRISAEQ